jgi:3-deoxy-D-manno-octulosonic-acid transferase
VFVGKSLFRCEGQNPLEAANAGKFVVTGQGMDNFRRIMHDLRMADAVKVARDPEELQQILLESLERPEAAWQQGERAAAWVQRCKGSIARSVEAFATLV